MLLNYCTAFLPPRIADVGDGEHCSVLLRLLLRAKIHGNLHFPSTSHTGQGVGEG